jgi:ParB family chromosome partitioning protein
MARGEKFEIIAGERRWRAAQLAGMQEVPTLVRRLDDQAAMCLSLIENIQRQDLNPMEQARALNRLLKEFQLTHEAVAEAVGRSRSTVTNLLRLLELEPSVRKQVEQGKLEMGHARAILALPANGQAEAAAHVVKGGLSVRATEALVRRMQAAKSAKKAGAPAKDPNIRQLETRLSETLGASVSIRHQKSGHGSVEIRYNSLNELDGILSRIK